MYSDRTEITSFPIGELVISHLCVTTQGNVFPSQNDLHKFVHCQEFQSKHLLLFLHDENMIILVFQKE